VDFWDAIDVFLEYGMTIDLQPYLALATIAGAALAPTLSSIWAGYVANKNAIKAASLAVLAAQKVAEVKTTLVETSHITDGKLDTIHVLVNNQLSQAVERLNRASAEIEELKEMLKRERGGATGEF
jgi:flagellar hook-associated protein FlgK